MSGCERCHKETDITTGSWLNTQMICMECSKIEEESPRYQEAKEADRQACLQGNFNFKGIGL